MKYIRFLDTITASDYALVGEKNYGIGMLFQQLSLQNIPIPHGFCITTQATTLFLEYNGINSSLSSNVDKPQLDAIHDAIIAGDIPPELYPEIKEAYTILYHDHAAVQFAVRPSIALAQKVSVSLAGQYSTFLGISGFEDILNAYKRVIASLFTDKAFLYMQQHALSYNTISLAVGIQKMVHAQQGYSGVVTTVEPGSFNADFFAISAAYGLGLGVVRALFEPDEYIVSKRLFKKGYTGIVSAKKGFQDFAIIGNGESGSARQKLSQEQKSNFVLSEAIIKTLILYAVSIEEAYLTNQSSTYFDIEWAYDIHEQKVYILQVTPHHYNSVSRAIHTSYELIDAPSQPYGMGQSIGNSVVSGVIRDIHTSDTVTSNDIVLADALTPAMLPILAKARGFLIRQGGRTSHAAIIAQNTGLTGIIGIGEMPFTPGEYVTLDCGKGSQGYIYHGVISFIKKEYEVARNTNDIQKLYVSLADPFQAFQVAQLPVGGVGLVRMEFIIAHHIGIHPNACLYPEKITAVIQDVITKRAIGYQTPADFYVAQLSNGIAMIAAAFNQRPVVIRLSDFKTNEYRALVGGEFFEQEEENPMLGFRGPTRYISPYFQEAFLLECKALHHAVYTIGCDNIIILVPFLRSIEELIAVKNILKEYALDALPFYMMVETPAHALSIEKYGPLCDGFSIGTNDLTQLTIGVDRDQEELQTLFNEQDEAVMQLIKKVLQYAASVGKPCGVCGQGPSHSQDLAKMLLDEGATSLALTPQAAMHLLADLSDL